MNAVHAAGRSQGGVPVQREACAVTPRHHQQGARECHLLALGQVLFRRLTQRQPAASAAPTTTGRGCRAWWRSVTSSSGGSGSLTCRRGRIAARRLACASLGIRPARRESLPASTAAHMLFAIARGSRAFETAVLSSTAEQPSSIASAASDAVPMPASSTTGTGERAQISEMRCGLEMPSPDRWASRAA